MCQEPSTLQVLLQLIGMFGSWMIACFYGVRLLVGSDESLNKPDRQGDVAHFIMALGMAYMFMPIAAWRVVPDSVGAVIFAALSLWFVLRLVLAEYGSKGRTRDVFHVGMNLGMTYMFVQMWFDSPVLTALFTAFFACYGTLHLAGLALHLRQRSSYPAKPGLFGELILTDLAHVAMAVFMIAMFMMPVHGAHASTEHKPAIDHTHHHHGMQHMDHTMHMR